MWIRKHPKLGNIWKEMMVLDVKAIAKYIRISPSKVNIVLKMIRGKSIKDAFSILLFIDKRSSKIIEKVLKSAVSNAENNNGMDINSLFVKEAYANEGPVLKRFRPRAQGRAFRINKRTTHITMVVGEI